MSSRQCVPNHKGSYILVAFLETDKRIRIGKLGLLDFLQGYYAYVGSAFGPGGLAARIRHHVQPQKRCHWHLDYLDATVVEVWVSGPDHRCEHEWAHTIKKAAAGHIPGFGCSDCRCGSHLFYFNSADRLDDFRKTMGGQVTRLKL
jgi:Uri superfamily endonuclease